MATCTYSSLLVSPLIITLANISSSVHLSLIADYVMSHEVPIVTVFGGSQTGNCIHMHNQADHVSVSYMHNIACKCFDHVTLRRCTCFGGYVQCHLGCCITTHSPPLPTIKVTGYTAMNN